jgi:hypothetical protein
MQADAGKENGDKDRVNQPVHHKTIALTYVSSLTQDGSSNEETKEGMDANP